MAPDIVNSAGLIFDIVGVLLLFKYGLPSDVGPEPSEPGPSEFASLLVEVDYDEEAHRRRERRWSRYRTRSRLGLGLLATGFGLQLASNVMWIVSNHAPLSTSGASVQSPWIFGSVVVGGVWLWLVFLAVRGRRD